MSSYTYEIIKEEVIPGSINDFRALMHEYCELQPHYSTGIIFLQGERTPTDYPGNMGRWELTLGGTFHKRGFVRARQLHNGNTKLQFAYHSKFQAIGSQFEDDFIESLLEKCFFATKQKPSLKKSLEDFGLYIQSQARMTFWEKKEKKYKWISRPERQAQILLQTFLNGKFDKDIYTFEEIRAGAGFIDLLVITSTGKKSIIELKMCGHRYSLKWAKSGIKQTAHYMKNKGAETGYLIVFDSRLRDFSKGIKPVELFDDTSVTSIFIDLRPIV